MSYKSVQIVNGGFEQFKTMYPMMTTNPKYEPVRHIEMHLQLSDIEYPTLDMIKMKTDSDSSKRPLSVDRSNKPVYLKPAEKAKMMHELVREQSVLLDKALEDEKEAAKLAADLEKTIREEPKENDDAKLRKWMEDQNQIEYKLLQVENKQSDHVSRGVALEDNFLFM